jgi:hypothetical protein
LSVSRLVFRIRSRYFLVLCVCVSVCDCVCWVCWVCWLVTVRLGFSQAGDERRLGQGGVNAVLMLVSPPSATTGWVVVYTVLCVMCERVCACVSTSWYDETDQSRPRSTPDSGTRRKKQVPDLYKIGTCRFVSPSTTGTTSKHSSNVNQRGKKNKRWWEEE